MTPLNILDIAQTFVDDYVVAGTQGLERRFHGATKLDGPVIAKTLECESEMFYVVGVIRIGPDGPFRMWYGCHKPGGGQPVHTAVSDDAVTWEKLPTRPDGSNRISFDDGTIVSDTSCAFFYDPNDEPARRYKMIHYKPSYYLSYSPDGIVWTPHSDQPVWANGSGDGLEECFFFLKDERLGKYRGYMRVWQDRHTVRRLGLGESDDLTEWTGPEVIWSAPPEYGVGAQIYGMLVHPEEGVYWGIPWMFYTSEPLNRRDQQTIKLKLAFSRDGIDWQSVFADEEVVPLGEPGTFDGEMMHTYCPVVSVGDKRLLYYDGHPDKHDAQESQGPGGIGLATFRKNGFVSLHADDEGIVLTKRFLFKGNALQINAKTADSGSVEAELLADNGANLDGYRYEDMDVFTGDATDAPLSWNGSSDLGTITGQYIMLRLRLRQADVFSFCATGDQELFESDSRPPPINCGMCATVPVIDGKLDDNCWQDFDHSGVAEDFVTFERLEPAPVSTRAMFTRDETHLYISVDCEEPLIDKLATNREENEPEFHFDQDDTVEFRLNAPQHGTFFNQVCVNAAGKRSQAWFSVEEGGSRMVPGAEWKAAVSQVGGHWYVEIAVPWTALNVEPPATGDKWMVNVIRHRNTDGYQISCWSCLFGGAHRNDLSGTLVFA